MSSQPTSFFTCKARYLIFIITSLCFIFFLFGYLDLPFKRSSDVQAQCTQIFSCSSTYKVGNGGGRDFGAKMCNPGDYVAGLEFVGHGNNESAYVVVCCRP